MLSTSLIAPLEIAKFVFFVSYVAATIGVIVGVYWEGDQFPKDKQQRGWTLLVRSLAADTLFTVLVFGTDGWISAIQRQEIIALTGIGNAIAPRGVDVNELTNELKDQPRLPVDILYTPGDSDSYLLANSISFGVVNAGWTLRNINPTPPLTDKWGWSGGYCLVSTGVVVLTNKLTKEEFDSLMKPLNERVKTPVFVLTNALIDSLRGSAAGKGVIPLSCDEVPPGMLQIVVAPKLVPTGPFNK
jgi:hypothetical protein